MPVPERMPPFTVSLIYHKGMVHRLTDQNLLDLLNAVTDNHFESRTSLPPPGDEVDPESMARYNRLHPDSVITWWRVWVQPWTITVTYRSALLEALDLLREGR